MKRSRRSAILIVGATVLCGVAACHRQTTRNRLDETKFPSVMIWAWERPEDLTFLDSHNFGVAFLAQTLTLKGDEVVFNPRHQPLQVPPDAKVMAVTRIESQKTTGQKPALSVNQRQQLVKLILRTLELGRVAAVQVDFDALVSERDFYRALLQDLRAQLPDKVPLSMTALASFCIGDRWLNDLPVDEAVPMIFRMGADDKPIRNMLEANQDFGDPICRRSYGIALDEPVAMPSYLTRRLYVFNNRSWTPADIGQIPRKFQP